MNLKTESDYVYRAGISTGQGIKWGEYSNHYISAFDYDYLDSMINRFEDLVKNESEHTTWWESVISKQLSEDYKKTHQYVQM